MTFWRGWREATQYWRNSPTWGPGQGNNGISILPGW